MGRITGVSFRGGPRVTETTPVCFIIFIGWVLLLAPVWVALFMAIFK